MNISTDSPRTKICQFCAEEVKIEAIVCKHCGKDLLTKPIPTAVKQKIVGNAIATSVFWAVPLGFLLGAFGCVVGWFIAKNNLPLTLQMLPENSQPVWNHCLIFYG